MSDAEDPVADQHPWTATWFPRGTAGFERVVFFSDAVFAIALTLVAVEIGVPEIGDSSSATELWDALLEKAPTLVAYAFTFFWIAFYWRANHRFAHSLAAMSGRFITATLVYLAFIALLPFPAATLGEYWDNPVAVSFFSVFAAAVSAMETVLIVVADRGGLFVRPLDRDQRRQALLGSLAPVLVFLAAVPLAFVAPWLAVAGWFVLGLLTSIAVNRLVPARW